MYIPISQFIPLQLSEITNAICNRTKKKIVDIQ